MKKICILILTFILLATSVLLVGAEENIKVVLDGNEVAFDVPPTMIEGRTMVPVRAIFESLGAKVEWDGATNAVNAKRDNVFITMFIDSKIMYVNGEERKLDVPAIETNGRALVPLRAISEAFGTEVGWDDKLSTVSIIDDKAGFKMLHSYDGRMKAFNNKEIDYQLTQGWYSAPVADVSKNIAQIKDFIKRGMYLEAIVECENLKNYNMTHEDSESIESLKKEAEIKYEEYLAAPSVQEESYSSYSGVYRTPTGKRYHFSSRCGGKNSYSITLGDAKRAGLTPCKKCTK